MTDKGSLIVISAPSGTGKGTILKKFSEIYMDDKMMFSISATTRAPREGEKDGVNYYFVSEERFLEDISSDGFLEHAVYCDNRYGTPKKAAMDAINSGIDVILEIETAGAMQVKESYPEAVMIFILPPSLEELRSRLVGRGTETEEAIEKRYTEALKELNLADKYDYVIVNDEVEKATYEFNAVIQSQRLKTRNNKKIISEVCKK